MLRNYLITAWIVFLRRKFFTFINLFGICITLTVIVIAVRVADNHLHPTGPERNNPLFLVIGKLLLTNEDHSNTNSSGPGFKFINDYVYSLKAPEVISAYTGTKTTPTYIQNKKVEFYLRRTDANYWKVLAFEFIHGQAFDQQQFKLGQSVAVISQQTALQYFNRVDVIGQSIDIQNQRFQVIGVTKNVPRTELEAFSDIWVPFTTFPTTAYRHQMLGGFNAILYHSNPDKLEDVKQEFINRLKYDFEPLDSGMTKAVSHADNKIEEFAREFMGDEMSFESYVKPFMVLISILTILFMALPSINMVNLNVSRIMERSSEIGVRKAFGASTKQLVEQFIVESFVLTLIGGLLAFLFSTFILTAIETSGLVPYVEFTFNFRVFAISLLMILIFSLISGVYPAFKMARLHPVIALKGGL